MNYSKTIKIFALSILFVSFCSCNKQKAEALKVAAERFRNEAILSLEQMNFLFNKSIEIVHHDIEQEVETVVNDLNSIDNIETINAALLDHWTIEAEMGNDVTASMNKEFEDLKLHYYQFEAIFNSVDQGNLLNKNSVKKAEKHAINLTLQLINFSKILKENQFRFTADRVLMIERMKFAKAEENEKLRNELLKNVAKEFVELRIKENSTKESAIKQCLKAAESGRNIAELIKNYDKLNVQDVLNSIKNSMNFATQISGGNEKIADLLVKFESVENTIKEDPYWQIILKQDINSNNN